MLVPTIYTIDAREHIYLASLTKHFGLESREIFTQINLLATAMVDSLAKKNIPYEGLKNALIPQATKKEIAFVFDSRKIDSSWYGYEVFKVLIPLLDKKSVNSILCGDFIGSDVNQDFFKKLFIENICTDKEVDYRHHSYFFLVYFNNLSEEHFAKLHDGLLVMTGYVGYFDLTYSSFLKTIFSTLLIKAILKYKSIIINPSAEEKDDINETGYPFEKNGYSIVAFDELTYGLFLSYKIERPVLPYESPEDQLFSINAISEKAFDVSAFVLNVEENKMAYLKSAKKGNMQMAGLEKLTAIQLSEIIRKKIKDNYFFNLTFLPEHKIMKFNIMIEIPRVDKNKLIKLTVALEYEPDKQALRLITMF